MANSLQTHQANSTLAEPIKRWDLGIQNPEEGFLFYLNSIVYMKFVKTTQADIKTKPCRKGVVALK